MSDRKPLILISNDDGYYYGGIKALIGVAREFGDVFVAAPTLHQSGMSSAITVNSPLRAVLLKKEDGLTFYRINGTPADCAKLAISQLLDGRKPDLLLSGINHGYNAGNSAIYSGTMGVVFEGLFNGIPSIGFSYGCYDADADFTPCLPYVRKIIGNVLDKGLPEHVCLNVNIPFGHGPIQGVKVTAGALGKWTHEFKKFTDPHGRDFYWITGDYEMDDPDDAANDLYWIKRGWVSVTPCHADQTDFNSMSQISSIIY